LGCAFSFGIPVIDSVDTWIYLVQKIYPSGYSKYIKTLFREDLMDEKVRLHGDGKKRVEAHGYTHYGKEWWWIFDGL
jgi:hypothetical protein